MQPKVVVVSTGGTIAMRYDPVKGGEVPAASGQELIAAVPLLADVIPLEVVEFSNMPSFHMTPGVMWKLAKEVEGFLARRDVLGVVVSHGTDTMEETAYFLDLYLAPEKPVCFTAAMRSGSDLSPDGPYNFLCAVRAAASPKTRGYGVLVVMNGEIHAARYATKTHTSSVAAFASPQCGPVGIIDADGILMRCAIANEAPLRPEALVENVPVIKIFTGMDSAFFEALRPLGIQGLVMEGYGRGNVPAVIIPALRGFLSQSIPVVAASRVIAGRTLGVYAAEGGAVHLRSLGVILSGGLSSQKARLKLMLALGCTRDPKTLAGFFAEMEEANI